MPCAAMCGIPRGGGASGVRVYLVIMDETDEARREGGALHHTDPAHYEAFKRNTAPYAERIVEVLLTDFESGMRERVDA